MAIDTAWVGIVGTLTGTTLGAALSWWAKRSEWKKESGIRWDVDKRQAYVRFLNAGNAYEEVVRELQSSEINTLQPGSIPRDKIDAVYKELQASLIELLFFANDRVGGAAQAYVRLLVPAFAQLSRGHGRGPYGWADVDFSPDELENGLVYRRGRFTSEARRDLGLASLSVLSPLPSGLDLP